jgi:hypothetical protein
MQHHKQMKMSSDGMGKSLRVGLLKYSASGGEIQVEASAGDEVEVVALKHGDQNDLHQVSVFPGNGLEGNIGQGGTKISLSGSDVVLRRAK